TVLVDVGRVSDLNYIRQDNGHLAIGVTRDQLAEFKKGLQAFVTFHDMRRKPVTVPVSLRGFTKALAALK
ncbi:MAG: invasion associated locus B family protein, partial [Pseudomonadota bacterium]